MVANPSASRNEPVARAFLCQMDEAARAALVATVKTFICTRLYGPRGEPIESGLTQFELEEQIRAVACAIVLDAPLVFAGETRPGGVIVLPPRLFPFDVSSFASLPKALLQ